MGLFACRNGEECIAGHLECDGVADCADASDEHEHCCRSRLYKALNKWSRAVKA